MMGLGNIRHHWPRLRYQLGKRLDIHGTQFKVRGYVANRLTTHFQHEKHLLAPLGRAMQFRAGPVVDVGVNTGQTLLKMLAIDPTRSYTGFEPQIGCCFFVDQFLRDNNLRASRVLCLALGDENHMLPLYSHSQFDEMASLAASSTGRYHQEFVQNFVAVRIGDEVFEEIGLTAPGVVKVDVEGAEIQVFKGLRQTITRSKPVCIFEVLPNFAGHERTPIDASVAAANRATAEELFALFGSLGYEIRQIGTDGGETRIERFDLDSPATYVGSDYVAYPAT